MGMSFRIPNIIGELAAKDFSGGGRWVKQISTYLLWFEFLAISPSYDLARRVRAGEQIDKELLPADFDRVLAMYDDCGNVQQALFRSWWREVGLNHFGFEGQQPAVTRVGYAAHTPHVAPDLSDNLAHYFADDWVEQGRQRTLILAVPVGMTQAKMFRQIKKHVERIKVEKRVLLQADTKYPLVGKRHHSNALMGYLRMAWFRAALHKKPLWLVGARANISQTYSPILLPNPAHEVETYTADRDIMTIIASRALLRARMISENAARGKFPTHDKCETALEFDFEELRQRIHRRNRWQEREIKRLKAKDSN